MGHRVAWWTSGNPEMLGSRSITPTPPPVGNGSGVCNRVVGKRSRFVHTGLRNSKSCIRYSIANRDGYPRTGDVVTVATRLFGGIVSLLTVFVLSFYMLLDEKQIDSLINLVVPSSITGEVRTVLEKIGVRVGGWVRGQVIISAIMGITTFVALSLVGLPYALTIGVAAAVFEVLPIIGPIVTAIVAVVIALGSGSWGMAIGTLVVFTILQQLEGHFVVPKVMQKAVGLSPVVIIVALLIGSVLAGVPGAILAVPAAACIDVLVDEWPHLRLAFERGRV